MWLSGYHLDVFSLVLLPPTVETQEKKGWWVESKSNDRGTLRVSLGTGALHPGSKDIPSQPSGKRNSAFGHLEFGVTL